LVGGSGNEHCVVGEGKQDSKTELAEDDMLGRRGLAFSTNSYKEVWPLCLDNRQKNWDKCIVYSTMVRKHIQETIVH